MKYILTSSKRYTRIAIIFTIIAAVISCSIVLKAEGIIAEFTLRDEIQNVLEGYFKERCNALISGDVAVIKNQFQLSSRYGQWSYEHEAKRIKFATDWNIARKVIFKQCESKLKIFSVRGGESAVRVYLNDRTKMSYIYADQKDGPLNEFCFATYHTMNLIKRDDKWYVTVDWYSDPLEDTIPDERMPQADTPQEETVSGGSWFKYDRAKAIEYADKYCGANYIIEDGYKYNKKYRSYADMGGDCANFVSQVLSDKSAGGIRTSGGWQYSKGKGSASWVNAGKFTYNLLYSGRGKLVSKGKYEKVVNYIGKVSPGDIIAYQKKGDIVHVSIITAVDSMGVPLVDSHTNDRYHVPWDLGWNSSGVTFWLIKLNG